MHSSLNDLVDKFISFSREAYDKIHEELSSEAVSKNTRGYLIICNFMRLSELFESVVLLAENKMPSGCLVILRTMTENYLHLHGCVRDEKFSREYIKKHVKEKKDRLHRMAPDLGRMRLKLTEEGRAKLEENQIELLEKQESEELKGILAMFRRFGKEELYHVVYAHCSLWTHNDSHTFDRYLTDDNNEIQITTYKEEELKKDVIISLLLALKLLFFAYEDVANATSKNPEYRTEFAQKYNEFHDNFESILNASN